MTGPQPRSRDDDNESVFTLVAQLARRATDGQLMVSGVVGIASAAVIGLVFPSLWFIALPLLCVGSFGIWGIADRTTAERLARLGPTFTGRRTLTGVRATAAVVGTLAGLLAILTIVARAVGTWKS